MKVIVLMLFTFAQLWGILASEKSSTCAVSCTKSTKYNSSCGIWGWWRCSRVRYKAHTCYRICYHGGWSAWTRKVGPCSKTCGSGIQKVTSTRTCTNPKPSGGGRPCSGSSWSSITQSCNTQSCPRDGGWTSFVTKTGSCSKTCGSGIQTVTKERTCTNPTPLGGGRNCVGPASTSYSQLCNTQNCPVNGGWSNYSLASTGSCSVSCGGGTRVLTYTRNCTEPRPLHGGADCTGTDSKDEIGDCNQEECPIHGGWTEFTLNNTGDCSVTCGGGEKSLTYTRSCTNPAPQYGGDKCDGSNTRIDTEDCNEIPCPDKCIQGQETYIKSSSNPQQYYQCANGVPILRMCPLGTVWNEFSTSCKHTPQIRECPVDDERTLDPDDCHNYRICSNGRYMRLSCTVGTGFSSSKKDCVRLADLPDCV